MLKNIFPAKELRGIASRNSKADEFKSVRHPLVEEEVARGWSIQKKNKTTTRLRRAKPSDRLLEDRVWTLLYRMGFEFLSGRGGAHILLTPEDPETPSNQIDVVGIDDEVALAIECKCAQKPRRYADFSGDLAKHVALRENFTRAVRTKFPSPHKRPAIFMIWTANLALSDNDRARAKDVHVPLFDEEDLVYYESLVSQIGPAARFQFLSEVLQSRAVPGLEITVPAIRTKIGGKTAYTFSVPPEYLLKIAFVSHRARGKASDIDAYQRMLKRSRLKSLRSYISEGGIFPTNIVVNIADQRWLSFDRGKQEGLGGQTIFGWLKLRPAYRVAWVIDGQHRLFAYAGHELARTSLISVMAFVGLPASEQARLFVDINAEQRKVKQSLLQELYAELHWEATDPEVRVQAILSKVIQALDADLVSPFNTRILKADDARSETRCISLTSVFHAMEKTGFFIAKVKGGEVVEYGPLWAGDNNATLKRTARVLTSYFSAIKEEAGALWDKGAGEGGGLAMNDGVTVCVNVLRSVFQHLSGAKKIDLIGLSDDELVAQVVPFGKLVGRYFAPMGPSDIAQFRALRGVQGQTAGTRRVEEAIRRSNSTFDPPGLAEYLERERAQTTTKAFEVIRSIETILQRTVLSELKNEFGGEEASWWFNGVPKGVRKKVDDRINEEGGKKGGREENFDLIDYREVVTDNWPMFEDVLARGKGSKDARTKWIAEVNDLRKLVMHASKGVSLPITEEQLAILQEIDAWLKSQIAGSDEVATG
jgi:DNA sulfur modification protein DndB